MTDFTENVGGRRKGRKTFQVQENSCQLYTLTPLTIPFRNEGEIKIFSDEGKANRRLC